LYDIKRIKTPPSAGFFVAGRKIHHEGNEEDFKREARKDREEI
jgi:hypothetical protein